MRKNIYLYKSGELKRQDYSLVLIHKSGKVYIPIEQCDKIFCFSSVTVNVQVFQILSYYNISIHFFNYYGNYIGKYTPKEQKNGKALFLQLKKYESEREEIALKILMASFDNMLALIKYYGKKLMLEDIILNFIDFKKQLYFANTVDQMLLIEANSKQIYYKMFDRILKNEQFKFIKRTKNPPENEVNAMLSYGYALLYSEIQASIDRSSLSPFISFVHSLEKESESLKYDLADIMKPVIIDRMVLRMIRKHQVNKECFEYDKNRCYLSKQGKRIFIEEYETNLNKTVFVNNRYYSYKQLLAKEVHNLSKYIRFDQEYSSFKMRW